MTKQTINWSFVLGRLMRDASSYSDPGGFKVDENGNLVEDYLDGDAVCSLEDELFDTGKTYRLCEGYVAEEDDDLAVM